MDQPRRSLPVGWLCAGLVALGFAVVAVGQPQPQQPNPGGFQGGFPPSGTNFSQISGFPQGNSFPQGSGFPHGTSLVPPSKPPKPMPVLQETGEVQALKKAMINGKYSKLLTVIHVPADTATYGNFNDYGHYTGTEWAGYTGLPQGYWVYVAPHWYIWESQGQAGGQANPPNPPGDQVKASVNGKYLNLLKVIDVPQDRGTYGDFNDYGFYTGTEWAGHQNLPQGYWVYVAPKWYIWGQVANKPADPAPNGNANPDQVKAAVGGKYSNLLRVINVPQDKADYGDFSDYGHYTGTEWAGYDNLPPGYWVYVSPNWYIWGKEGGKQGGGIPKNFKSKKAVFAPPGGVNNDQVKASLNGKYSNLLKVINVPGDQASYGDFKEWGQWNGTEWAGHQNLPPGHWVYVAPNWYIWGTVGAPMPQPKPNLPIGADPRASVNGKYANLLKVIDVPGDQGAYGPFTDYGHYTGSSWGGHNNLPPGYWVYVAPKWYIWGQVVNPPPQPVPVKPPVFQPNPLPNPNPPAPAGQDQVKASVNGKYGKLLKVINVPQDQATYGDFNDYGFYSGTSWAGHDNLPPGYWVYVGPNWYIWGEQK